MLSLVQLSNRIADLLGNRLSVGEFEEWFRDEFENVHLWGDGRLLEAVESIESVFSEYHFGGLGRDEVALALANAMRPFVQRRVLSPHLPFVRNERSKRSAQYASSSGILVVTYNEGVLTMTGARLGSSLPAVPLGEGPSSSDAQCTFTARV